MSASTAELRPYAIRIPAIDDLFVAFDARPVAERPLRDEVRLWLLDEWEHVREARPSTLHVHAPASDRAATDEHAVGVAVWAGVVIFLLTIAVSTALEKSLTGVLVVGISQAVVVIGWVALWDPAQRVAGDIVPHYFLRKRYAELAEIEVRFVWHDAGGA
jgi:hypothetical protein